MYSKCLVYSEALVLSSLSAGGSISCGWISGAAVSLLGYKISVTKNTWMNNWERQTSLRLLTLSIFFLWDCFFFSPWLNRILSEDTVTRTKWGVIHMLLHWSRLAGFIWTWRRSRGGFRKDDPRIIGGFPHRHSTPQSALGFNLQVVCFNGWNLSLRASAFPMRCRTWVFWLHRPVFQTRGLRDFIQNTCIFKDGIRQRGGIPTGDRR